MTHLIGTSSIMAAIGLGIAVLTIVSVRICRRFSHPLAWLVPVIGVGLTYDNVVVAFGRFIGYGPTLYAINLPRFWIHALLTPMIIVAAAIVVGRLGVRLRLWVRIAGLIGVLALIAVGVVEVIATFDLQPESAGDAVRYVNVAAHGPPVPAIATVLAVIGLGGAAWRVAGERWLCLGALVMMIAAGAGASTLWVGNLGELVLFAALVVTMHRAAPPAEVRPRHPMSILRSTASPR